jgi:hypothetical protein
MFPILFWNNNVQIVFNKRSTLKWQNQIEWNLIKPFCFCGGKKLLNKIDFFIFLYRFDISKIIFLKNIILIYFQAENTLKNN